MIWDQETPCATRPYRRDAKLRLWAEVEFTDLRARDAEPLTSSVYGCHSSAKLPEPDRRPCAGWLLDQKQRGLPSIPLRLVLIQQPQARELMDRVNAGGVELYDSIQEMHETNYPSRRRMTAQGRPDWKISDAWWCDKSSMGKAIDERHARLAAAMEATGREVTHVAIRERHDLQDRDGWRFAEVTVYGRLR